MTSCIYTLRSRGQSGPNVAYLAKPGQAALPSLCCSLPCLKSDKFQIICLAEGAYLEVGRVHKQRRQVAGRIAGALLALHAMAVKDAEQRIGAARETLVNYPGILQMPFSCSQRLPGPFFHYGAPSYTLPGMPYVGGTRAFVADTQSWVS